MKMNPDCPYNSMLECPECEHKCSKCGWNPTVKEARLKKRWAVLEKARWVGLMAARAGLKQKEETEK